MTRMIALPMGLLYQKGEARKMVMTADDWFGSHGPCRDWSVSAGQEPPGTRVPG
jgi:hypothetical protein